MASIQQFLDYLLYEKKYSSHTVLAYQKDLETFAVFIQNQFEEEELREVNYSMIRSWIISLVDNGISNRSINRKISSLKTFYKFLLKIKEIETSPLVKHKSLKVDKKVQVPFSSKEVSEVIESFQPNLEENHRCEFLTDSSLRHGVGKLLTSISACTVFSTN